MAWLGRGHFTRLTAPIPEYAARDEDRERALEFAGSVSGVRTGEDDLCILEVDPCCVP